MVAANHLDAQPSDGATPIDPDEAEALIPNHLTTRVELNQWEALNISHAEQWISTRSTPIDALSANDLADLHKRMFGNTWAWAGQYRQSDKNISPHHWTMVPMLVQELIKDVKERYSRSDKTAKSLRDIAMRFHHRLVLIHPWPNGNGRHARLATDLLLVKWGLPRFDWGHADLVAESETRARYIAALRTADDWDYGPLRRFLRIHE